MGARCPALLFSRPGRKNSHGEAMRFYSYERAFAVSSNRDHRILKTVGTGSLSGALAVLYQSRHLPFFSLLVKTTWAIQNNPSQAYL
jgi:precorrin-6x reductase